MNVLLDSKREKKEGKKTPPPQQLSHLPVLCQLGILSWSRSCKMCLKFAPQEKSIFIPFWLVSWRFSVIFARDSSISTGCTATSVQMLSFFPPLHQAGNTSHYCCFHFSQCRVALPHNECYCNHYIVFALTASVGKRPARKLSPPHTSKSLCYFQPPLLLGMETIIYEIYIKYF